jgi:phosphoglycolate phosphatase
MTFDGLIFDLDGTLWDCSQASTDALNQAFEVQGISKRVTRELVRSLTGKPESEFNEILLADLPSVQRAHVQRLYDQLEIDMIVNAAATTLYPSVEQGIKTLREISKLFVVSNCGVRYLEIFHRHTPIGGDFTDSESFGRTQMLKHDNIKAVVERNSLRSPCYIGDTAGDEEAATRAGIPFFHVEYGFGRPLRDPRSFANFEELTQYFVDA